jgi:hypothetical protein
MTDGLLDQVPGAAAPAPGATAELAFLYRISAERERQLPGILNWRSFPGYRRKRNAGWGGAGTGVRRFRGVELGNAGGAEPGRAGGGRRA